MLFSWGFIHYFDWAIFQFAFLGLNQRWENRDVSENQGRDLIKKTPTTWRSKMVPSRNITLWL